MKRDVSGERLLPTLRRFILAFFACLLMPGAAWAHWAEEDLPDLVLDRRPLAPQRLAVGGECNVREIRFQVLHSPARIDAIEAVYEFYDGRPAGTGALVLKDDHIYAAGETSSARGYDTGWRPLIDEEGKCIRALVVHGHSLPGGSANAVIRFSARRWAPPPPPPAGRIVTPPPPHGGFEPLELGPERFLGVTALDSSDMNWDKCGYSNGPGPNERAYIGVHECGLTRLRLQARYKGASIRQVRIYFRDGSSQVEHFPHTLAADRFSEVLDLAGVASRCVSGVVIIGHGAGTRDDGLLSVIELYGQLGRPVPPPPRGRIERRH